jgi:hypothetical protein
LRHASTRHADVEVASPSLEPLPQPFHLLGNVIKGWRVG